MSKLKKRFSAWNVLWMLPLALVLALAVFMYVIPALEKVDKTPASRSSDWMKTLPDDKPLSEVVLPGTHDSATQYVQLAYFSKCQALDIRGQLEAGYRYLDIRLGDGEGLPLMHGFVNCTVSGWPWAKTLCLETVLEDCYAFLEAHPTETVLFCVKHEHGEASAADFAEALGAYVYKAPERWYSGSAIPTVGEARGKLVLLKRFDDGGRLPGAIFAWKEQKGFADPGRNTQKYENPECTLFVQDRFEYNSDEKWNAFLVGMDAGETAARSVSLNFLSTKGHAKYGHPYTFAELLNYRLADAPNAILKGWVIVDFGSAALAEHIYSVNFD